MEKTIQMFRDSGYHSAFNEIIASIDVTTTVLQQIQ